MGKYRLIHVSKQNTEHLCDKVTIDGFDYYVGGKIKLHGENLENGKFYIEHTQIKPDRFSLFKRDMEDDSFENCFLIIATTNPNINIPKVVNEVDGLAEEITTYEHFCDSSLDYASHYKGVKIGYNKSQETHPFNEKDVRFMLSEAFKASQEGYQITTDEIIQIWKEQQPKKVYYDK